MSKKKINKGILVSAVVLALSAVGIGVYSFRRGKQVVSNDIKGEDTAVSTPSIQILSVGDTIKPRSGSVNIRKTPMIAPDNILIPSYSGENIGKIKKLVKGNDGFTWYQVVLLFNILTPTAYVRSDVVVKA